MKFSIGDQVLLKRTGEEGILRAFLKEGLVEVEVNHILFPVYEDELEHPYLNWFTQTNTAKGRPTNTPIPPEEKRKPQRLSRGIYLSFLPEFETEAGEEFIRAFQLYLINETVSAIQFSYDARTTGGKSLLSLKGQLPAFGQTYLHRLSLEVMNAQPRFHWQVSPAMESLGKGDVLRIRGSQLARHMQCLLEEGSPSFQILLAEDAEAIPAQTTATPLPAPAPSVTTQKSPQMEPVPVLDLHLKNRKLHGVPALEIQMALLQEKLDAAHVAGLQQMIIIHGLGAGILRAAVHELLRSTDYVRSYRNEWMPKYGWGATEVIFKT